MADQVLKRHPIRGFLYGIFFGLGLALVGIGQGWAALGTAAPFVLFVIGLVVGTLWGIFGPSKKPKGPAPAEPIAVDTETSRFDDFDAPEPEDLAAEIESATDTATDTAADTTRSIGDETESASDEGGPSEGDSDRGPNGPDA